MLNIYRIVLMGVVLFHGAGLIAMDQLKKSNELSNSGKIKQSAAVKFLIDRANPLRCSDELRQEEVQKTTYFYAGKALSPEDYPMSLNKNYRRDMYPYHPIY